MKHFIGEYLRPVNNSFLLYPSLIWINYTNSVKITLSVMTAQSCPGITVLGAVFDEDGVLA